MIQNQISIKSNGNTDDSFFKIINESFYRAIIFKSNIDNWILDIEGLSGKKYRHLINNLINNFKNPKYLEIGTWLGSTACSAVFKNKLKITCIDNWSESFSGVVDPEEKFFENIKRSITNQSNFKFIKKDFREINYKKIGKYNIYFFDGPHHLKDHFDALSYVFPALEKKFIFIVDDWNWNQVKSGTFKAIKYLKFNIISYLEIETNLKNGKGYIQGKKSDWHNGCCLFVIEK